MTSSQRKCKSEDTKNCGRPARLFHNCDRVIPKVFCRKKGVHCSIFRTTDRFRSLPNMQMAHLLCDHQIHRTNQHNGDGRGDKNMSAPEPSPTTTQQKHPQIKRDEHGRIEAGQCRERCRDCGNVKLPTSSASQPQIELIDRNHHHGESWHFQHHIATVIKDQRRDGVQDHYGRSEVIIQNATCHAIHTPARHNEAQQDQPARDVG